MLSVVHTEFVKLRRSLALLLCIAAPTMVALLAAVMMMEWKKTEQWQTFAMQSAAMWSFFMLPMTVTALTVLIAQIDHGPKTWNHLLALPIPRWRFYAAKAFVVAFLVAGMSAALLVLLPLAGTAAEAIASGRQLTGSYPWRYTASLLGTMFVGSLLLIAIQLWAALRFRSFVPPLVIGIGGTFVAVAATASKQGAFFPWLIPTNALASDPQRAAFAIDLGLYGGIAMTVLMLVDMSRKEAL
ncbi:MAG TPA: ABC transporter permease [Allosphingosinicella sp.]|nr:ABC transporter permease [Allosphingosinicella sp.]